MKTLAPQVGLICVLMILILLSFSKESEVGDKGLKNSASQYMLYTVRADGLCLYAKVEKDGSYQRFADKTRVWLPYVKDKSVMIED